MVAISLFAITFFGFLFQYSFFNYPLTIQLKPHTGIFRPHSEHDRFYHFFTDTLITERGLYVKVQLTIHEQYKEIEVHVLTDSYTPEVEQLMKSLKTSKSSIIDGYTATEIRMLKLDDIYTIYTENNKVYFQTDEEEFESKRKLYELEELLETSFVKVNKSTLVNLSKILSIQMGIVSTPQLILDNDAIIHVSRKYFKLLKAKLLVGRDGS